VNALVLLLVLGVVAGLTGALARAFIGWAESRRGARWSHILSRFCGDSGCGVCRSLSATVPRLARPVG
jgi:H+/Cl- antiporter ClcA